MQNTIQTINATEVNFIEGTLNKWMSTNQKPSSEEINQILATVKTMQEKLPKLSFKPESQNEAIQLLENAEKQLTEGSSQNDAKLVQANLQKTTKIVTEALLNEVDKLGLDAQVQRKVKHAIEEALIELEGNKPKTRNVEDSLKKTANILKETDNVIDKLKKLIPYAELVGLWLGKTLVSLGWV